MKKEVFLFKTKINLIKPFLNEMKNLKIREFKVFDETNHDVRIEMETIEALKILQKSMLLESVKVLIASGKKVDSEKTLKMGLSNIDFFRYLPSENSKFYYLPYVNTITARSFLFHSKMISNIIRSHILKVNKNFNLEPQELASTKRKIDDNKSSEMVYLNLPNITINILNNSLSAWMDLSIKKLNQRGYKLNTKQDSLKEDLASALVILSGVNDYSKIIWDPFCGCGTIIIESIILKSKNFKRDFSNFKYLKDMSFITEDNKTIEFVNNEISNYNIDKNNYENISDVKYYASDISPISFEYSLNNFKNSKIHIDNKGNVSNINPLILKENINSYTTLLLGDYEKIFKIIQNENKDCKTFKMSILTHLPYKLDDNVSKTIKLYREFSLFLKKNYDVFDSVHILIKKRDKKDQLNFENLSELQWDTIGEFSNEGIDTKLIRLKI